MVHTYQFDYQAGIAGKLPELAAKIEKFLKETDDGNPDVDILLPGTRSVPLAFDKGTTKEGILEVLKTVFAEEENKPVKEVAPEATSAVEELAVEPEVIDEAPEEKKTKKK